MNDGSAFSAEDTAAPRYRRTPYYAHCRTELLALVPKNRNNRILEIGAGSGATLIRAKELGLADFVTGVEAARLEGDSQSHPALDRFIIGDIDVVSGDLERDFYDVILCGDVLEHLTDPWRTLRGLAALLRQDGVLIASIPNVRYWKVSFGLLFLGKWNYGEHGVLDRTHLRFFVKDTIRELFDDAGFAIRDMQRLGPQRNWGLTKWALDQATFGLLSDFLTVQYIVVASKSGREGSASCTTY